MAANGHGNAPDAHRGDGMFWMHCKFLAKEKGKHSEEAKDFELAALAWLEKMKEGNPQRAYSNAIVFKEVYGLSGANGTALSQLIQQLGSTPENVQYHEALLEINEVSNKYFAPLGEGGGSVFNHKNAKSNRAVEALQETYGHIPAISKVLDAMLKNTVKK